jgi:hypothetical protein
VVALLPACSFVFVKEQNEATVRDPSVPISCTSSRMWPLADLVVGAILGGLAFGATYTAISELNDEEPCANGGCYSSWKAPSLAAFLVVSPWWISSAVGFSDTGRCRDAYRTRGMPLPP